MKVPSHNDYSCLIVFLTVTIFTFIMTIIIVMTRIIMCLTTMIFILMLISRKCIFRKSSLF